MTKGNKRIIAYIIIIASQLVFYGVGVAFFDIVEPQENNIKEEGWELVGLQYLIGLLITTLLASLYALLRLISEHFIIPLLDKIFKDDD